MMGLVFVDRAMVLSEVRIVVIRWFLSVFRSIRVLIDIDEIYMHRS